MSLKNNLYSSVSLIENNSHSPVKFLQKDKPVTFSNGLCPDMVSGASSRTNVYVSASADHNRTQHIYSRRFTYKRKSRLTAGLTQTFVLFGLTALALTP